MKKLNNLALENLQGGSPCPDGYTPSGAARIPAGVCVDAIGWGWCNGTTQDQVILLCKAADGNILPVLIH